MRESILAALTGLLLALAGCAAERQPGESDTAATLRIVQEVGWPLQTELHLAGGDPTSTDVSWILDVDDVIVQEGTALPATIPYVFSQAKTYNVTFALTDGASFSAEKAVVDAKLAAAASGLGQDQAVFWLLGPLDPCPVDQPLPLSQGDGLTYDQFDLDPSTVGLPFRVQVEFAQTIVLSGHEIKFLDAAGTALDYGFADWERSWEGDVGIIEGLIPDQSASAVVWACEQSMLEGSFVSGVLP